MTPFRAALVAGGGLCVTGFGVMAALSRFYSKPEDALGFTDYLSATWGDALLLPASLGGLVYAFRSLKPVTQDRIVVLIGAACGAAGGAVTQLLWLLDSDPQLNWTLPEPHVFNGAGIYHAVFLTGAATTFAALWAGVLLRWSRDPQGSTSAAGRAIVIALVAGLGFAVLLFIDNQQTTDRSSSASSLIAVGGAAAVGIVGISAGAWLRRRRSRSTQC